MYVCANVSLRERKSKKKKNTQTENMCESVKKSKYELSKKFSHNYSNVQIFCEM